MGVVTIGLLIFSLSIFIFDYLLASTMSENEKKMPFKLSQSPR